MNINESDISLDEIDETGDLSVRSVNICKDAELTSLKRILDFYEKKKSFISLRNCGSKTEIELVELCKKYQNSKSTLENTINKISTLTPIHKATLNRQLEYLISNLSVKAKNGLHKVSKTLNPKEIFDKIFNDEFNFKNIQNIRDKSVEELDKLKNDVYNFVEMLQTIKNEQLSKVYVKLIIKSNFSNLPQNFDEQIESTYDNNGKIKLFRLIELLLNFELLLNKKKNRIFIFSYHNLNTEKNTLQSIGTELQVTRERVRQIKTNLEDEIQKYLLFISNFVIDDFVNYGIDNTKSFKVIDKDVVNNINQNEEVKFNSTFYSIIFGIFLTKSHSILGNNEPISSKRKTTNKKNYKNYYLISNTIFECFNFSKFADDVNTKITERITESYSLHFEGYLCWFANENGLRRLSEIKPVCEAIIFSEFELLVDSTGYIYFERTTKKQVHEYCYDVLEEASVPMKIDQIANSVSNKFPDFNTTIDSLRGSLNREKELFIYFGRTSTYALRKWEQEKENLKGGTIRDIVEEYLLHFETPKHVSEILEYLKRYRPDTKESSLLSNIKLEKTNRFSYYTGGFVGLGTKDYTRNSVNFKKLIGIHFRSSFFEKMSGWDFNDIVNYYVNSFGYNEVRIEILIKKKIEEGKLKFSQDNKLII